MPSSLNRFSRTSSMKAERVARNILCGRNIRTGNLGYLAVVRRGEFPAHEQIALDKLLESCVCSLDRIGVWDVVAIMDEKTRLTPELNGKKVYFKNEDDARAYARGLRTANSEVAKAVYISPHIFDF